MANFAQKRLKEMWFKLLLKHVVVQPKLFCCKLWHKSWECYHRGAETGRQSQPSSLLPSSLLRCWSTFLLSLAVDLLVVVEVAMVEVVKLFGYFEPLTVEC